MSFIACNLDASVLLHECYLLAYFLADSHPAESVDLLSTDNVGAYVRTILDAILIPKSTFRKKDLLSSIIKKTLDLLAEHSSKMPMSYESDPHKDKMPTRHTIEEWIRVLSEPLIRGCIPYMHPEKKTFQDWKRKETGYSKNQSLKKAKKAVEKTREPPTKKQKNGDFRKSEEGSEFDEETDVGDEPQ